MHNNSRGFALFLPLIIILLIIGLLGYFIYQSSQSTPITTITDKNSEMTMPAEEFGGWVVEVPIGELKASTDLIENNLIRAHKSGKTVSVYKENITSGSETSILEYDEVEEAGMSGNLWEGMAPSVALSTDGSLLAYVHEDGLNTISLENSKVKELISKTNEPENKDGITTPDWSIDEIKDTYHFAKPRWSANNKYVSILEAYWEGNGHGIIDHDKLDYFKSNTHGGYINWSTINDDYAIPLDIGGYSSEPGLYVTSDDDIENMIDISENFGEGKSSFYAIDYSSDGKSIAFVYKNEMEEGEFKIAMSDVNGGSFKVLTEGYSHDLLFSSDGNELYYMEGDILSKYDLQTDTIEKVALLPKEYEHYLPEGYGGWNWGRIKWTKDGYLMINGTVFNRDLKIGLQKKRLVILDLSNNEVIYASPTYTYFTTFAGFTE